MGEELPTGYVLDEELPPGFTLDSEIPVEAPQVSEDPYTGLESKSMFSDPGAMKTIESFKDPIASLETAANFITSSYGIPAAGLGSLATLFATGDLDKANTALQSIQDLLVYKQQSEGGQQQAAAIAAPFELLEEGAGAAGEFTTDITGSPDAGAAVHSAISSAPLLLGAKSIMGRTPGKAAQVLNKEMSAAIKNGVSKSKIIPTGKKGTYSKVQKYYKQAESAVKEIVNNVKNLDLIDETGAKVEGLPKTLDQFSQAIEQTKRVIFEEYDKLAKQSDAFRTEKPATYPINKYANKDYNKPIKIDLSESAKKLDTVINNKVLADLSPETIEYAKKRIESLQGRAKYTAVETQEAIQFLNQTLDKFYRDPSPAMKGQAMVDALIANDLRTQLDAVINQTTGKQYSVLKKKYGDLKAIESDVTKRSLADSRKNNKGLLDFSDIITGHHVVRGMMAKDPAMIAGGAAIKMTSQYFKFLNDPNRIVKNMFADVERILTKQEWQTAPKKMNSIESLVDRFNKGELNPKQLAAFNELRKRGKL